MQEFFDIAKTDFMDTFGGAWLFPLLAVAALWILWQEKDPTRKLLLGALPLIFLLLYWCPLTGILFTYWGILYTLVDGSNHSSERRFFPHSTIPARQSRNAP